MNWPDPTKDAGLTILIYLLAAPFDARQTPQLTESFPRFTLAMLIHAALSLIKKKKCSAISGGGENFIQKGEMVDELPAAFQG